MTTLPTIARDFEYTYEGQTITYTVIDEDAKTVMTKAGDTEAAGNNVTGDLKIPSTVKSGNTEYTVVSIGDYGFLKCAGLTSATIPNTVTEIGLDAFYDCSSLKTVTIPNSVTSIGRLAFCGECGLETVYFNAENCIKCGELNWEESTLYQAFTHKLKNVYFGDKVKKIPDLAFSFCTGLTSVTIPNSVTEIGSMAFFRCSGITSLSIGNSVTTIRDNAFCVCSSLKSVTIPNSVTNIETCAFSSCSSLTSLTIPNSLTKIGMGVFQNCSSLTSVSIPNSVTEIDWWAFQDCTSLSSITIPNNITSINGEAFKGCSSLETVNFNAENCTTCGVYNQTEHEAYPAFPSNLKQVNFGDKVKIIPSYSFYECTGITSIEIPNSVKEIGDYAFSWCPAQKISIGDGVETIGVEAFAYNSDLKELTIGANVKSIGDDAFFYGENIENIYCRAQQPPVASTSVFENYTATLYVPTGRLDVYKDDTANCWSEFTSIIEKEFEYEGGIENIVNSNDKIVNIFNLQGICVKRNATEDDVKALSPGIYIVGGKKVVVR